MKWEWKGADGDYGYPFELDASVYRKEFVENIINSLNNWEHPNLLEGLGANSVKNFNEQKYLYAFSNPKSLVIQINRVQDLSPNSFYDVGYDVETLFNLWKKGEKLDLDYYRKEFNSVYVKDFMLEGEEDKIEITIGVPIWNQNVSYFKRCLESIKNQSYQNFECIVLDDGSDNKEEVEEITKEFGFKYIYQKNAGIGSARQSIVDNASKESEYICFLSSDDIWDEKFLEIMIKEAEKHPKKIIYSSYQIVDGEENIVGDVNPPTYDSHEDFCIFCWNAAERNTLSVNFSCIFISRVVFESVQFDVNLRYCEDLDFHLLSQFRFFDARQRPLKAFFRLDSSQSKIAGLLYVLKPHEPKRSPFSC